jgi:hypothetical protein
MKQLQDLRQKWEARRRRAPISLEVANNDISCAPLVTLLLWHAANAQAYPRPINTSDPLLSPYYGLAASGIVCYPL